MGQGIYYCCRCQIQLRSKDFDQGTAVHFNAQAYCAKCVPEEARILPGPPHPTSAGKNKSIPLFTEPPPSSSRRIPVVTEPSSAGAYGALAVVGILGLVALFWIVGSAGSDRAPAPRPAPEKAASVDPAPSKVVVVPPEEPPKPPVRRESALLKARNYVRSNPSDFIGQAELYEQALPELRGTGGLEEAKRELESVRKTASERVAAELAALDPRTREAAGKEQFDRALDLIEETRRRLNAPEWQAAINQRSEGVRRQASDLFAAIKKDALDARGRGQADQVKALQDRVVRWGLEPLAADLAKTLAEPVAVKDPKPPPVSTEAVAFAASRENALVLARAREYTAALVDLKRAADGLKDEALRKKAAEDLEALREAALALKELSKWQKGKTLSAEFLNAAGTVERVDGAIVRLDAHRVELMRNTGEPVVIPLGEIRLGPLAAQINAPRGVALLGVLEGEPETSREQEARAHYHTAEQAYEFPASTAGAVQKHATLLKDYADTMFVRRNRAFIQVRSQGGRDYFLFPEDMTAGGSFAWVKNPKTETCFSSTSDMEPGRSNENFVEIPFSVLPGTDYRCWVHVGACCAETFAFAWQATELAGKDAVPCEPGGAAFLPARHTLLGLKKTHSLHSGPKAPTRWEWIALPLPKYAQGGPKKLRILTNQEGFSVGFAFISTTKPGPPDYKTQEKARLETPGARALNRSAPPPKAKPAADDQVVLWKLDLDGGKKPGGLTTGTVEKAPERPDRFCLASQPVAAGNSPLYVGEGNGMCTFSGDEVLSFEFWVDSNVTHIVYNVYNRTLQKTHSAAIEKPVQGKWTRHSVRLADLTPDTPFRVGDLAAGVYMHASGGSTRMFFVDNLQFVRPRVKK